MKMFYYICFIFLASILVFFLIYNGNAKQLHQAPLTINSKSVVKVEIIYSYEKGFPKKKKIELSDLDKVLNIIKSYIIPDIKPQKSCPWIDFVLYKENGKKNYINLLLRNNDIMVQVGKKSWLIPSKNKGKLKKYIEEILSN